MTLRTLILSAAVALASVAPAVAALPKNVCAIPAMIRATMHDMNNFPAWQRTGLGVVDLTNAQTLFFNGTTGEIACHVTAEFTNGTTLSGVMSSINNSVGDGVSRWIADR